jgi:hypothetical protein
MVLAHHSGLACLGSKMAMMDPALWTPEEFVLQGKVRGVRDSRPLGSGMDWSPLVSVGHKKYCHDGGIAFARWLLGADSGVPEGDHGPSLGSPERRD